jgi:hypothetical protein
MKNYINGFYLIVLFNVVLLNPPEIYNGSAWSFNRTAGLLEASKNTVASWIGMSINLEDSRYYYADINHSVNYSLNYEEDWIDVVYKTGFSSGYTWVCLLTFASILPYLMLVLFFLSIFNYFIKRKRERL